MPCVERVASPSDANMVASVDINATIAVATPEHIVDTDSAATDTAMVTDVVSPQRSEPTCDEDPESGSGKDDLTNGARDLLNDATALRIEITPCESDPESDEEEFSPLPVDQAEPSIPQDLSDQGIEVDNSPAEPLVNGYENAGIPPAPLPVEDSASININATDEMLRTENEACITEPSLQTIPDTAESEVALHGNKSPISRISTGGSVYGEPADSPMSIASLDAEDVGIPKKRPSNLADTPGSLNASDIILHYIEDADESLPPKAPLIAPLTVTTKPIVSNPLSGDEGSLEPSSPESLSPNEAITRKTIDVDSLLGSNPSLGVDPQQTPIVVDGFPDNDNSPDVESGFADFPNGDLMHGSLVMPLGEVVRNPEVKDVLNNSGGSILDSPDLESGFGDAGSAPTPEGSFPSVCTTFDPFSSSSNTAFDVDPFSLLGGSNEAASLTAAALVDGVLDDVINSAKEGSPFNNGFHEAKVFNEMVQSSLSPNAAAFEPTASLDPVSINLTSSKASSLSPDAPAFVPTNLVSSTITEEAAEAMVESWGPPLGLPPPPQPKNAPGTAGAKTKPAGSSAGAKPKAPAANRPGTATKRVPSRAPSPASSTTSGKKGPVTKKGPAGAGSKAATPPPSAPVFVDVAYVPTKPEMLGKFFTQVRAKNYVLSCVDSPAAVLEALLDAKEKDWNVIPSPEGTTVSSTNVIPTHEGSTLRTWIPANLERMSKLAVEIAIPVERCSLHLDGRENDARCPAYVLTCN